MEQSPHITVNPPDRRESSRMGQFFVWLGVALLAASWLPGLGYYHPVNWQAWLALNVLGWLCMSAAPRVVDDRSGARLVAGVISLPALLVAPWPYRAGVLAFALGCLVPSGWVRRIPRAGRLLQRLPMGAMRAGVVLLVQAITINAYAALTSRSHELPAPLPHVLGGVASLLGIESAVHDHTVALHSMRTIHLLGATWELLLDPVTVGFLVAGIVVAWLIRSHQSVTPRSSQFPRQQRWRVLTALALVVLAWLPLRAGLLIALYLHDVLRTPYDAELDAMRLFWSTPVHLVLLAGPVLIFTAWGPQMQGPADAGAVGPPATGSHRYGTWLPSLAAALGILVMTLGLFWDPIGERLAGRVIVEEYHPNPARIWEPTGRAYDTTWYGQASGYNYACIYDYCSRYYTLSRSTQPITQQVLSDCDVLILKVPTRPYSDAEIDQVAAFVESGGGLLLIGEHTNVYRTGDYLNSVASRFGFQFRADCLFGIDSVFDQAFRPPLVPHPIVQHLTEMDFATSCSIAPGFASGRAPIRSLALKNKMADYHADNYYPHPGDDAAMRYGAFVQLWATRHGKGRVVAFSDSTIFSNFCVFEPGKAELLLGMIEWLNHRSDLRNPRPVLVTAGMLLVALSLGLAVRGRVALTSLLAAGLLGWSVAIVAVGWVHQHEMPPPPRARDCVQVVLDRTLSDVPLSKNGFVDASGDGFGVFAQWILRLGYFTSRRGGSEVFDADLVLVIAPDRVADDDYVHRLERYIRSGGVVAIVDYARSGSTTNTILDHFGLGVDQAIRVTGVLAGPGESAGASSNDLPRDLPEVPIEQAVAVQGGEPFAWVEGQPVATRIRLGAGTLIVVGFGSRFRDANMGHGMDVEPDSDLEQVFQLEYRLLRWMVSQAP